MSDFTDSLGDMMDRMDKGARKRRREQNYFPEEVFPHPMQNLISSVCKKKKFNNGYLAASMLHAAAAAIGNTYWTRSPYPQGAVMYMSLIGPPGTNKTHPLNWSYRPLREKEDEVAKRLKAIERSDELAAEERDRIMEEAQYFSKFLLSDATPAAIADTFKDNERGGVIVADELSRMFAVTGTNAELLLASFSFQPVIIDRKTTGRTRIPCPFIPIIGTMQPKILKPVLSKKHRMENGFADRMLWVLPKEENHGPLERYVEDEQEVQDWKRALNKLLDVRMVVDADDSTHPHYLSFSEAGEKKMLEHLNRNDTECHHNLDDETLQRIRAKMDIYVLRFTLPLQLLKWAFGEGDKNEIDEQTVDDAITLSRYFTQNAHEVWEMLSKSNPLDLLAEDRLKVYNRLPDRFATGKGIAIAEMHQLPSRTFHHWLKGENGKLFKRINHGWWEKVYKNY